MPVQLPQRYGAVTQALHWATALLVLVAFVYGPGGPEDSVFSSGRDAERQLHETLGLCVFALLVLRVLWRLVDERPAGVPMPRSMHLVSKAVQGLLYLLLAAVPLTAIAGSWLEGHALTLLGGLAINAPVAASHELGASIAEIHGWLGDTILWLAGLHAAAGLYHHFARKDGVLASMLPRWLHSGGTQP